MDIIGPIFPALTLVYYATRYAEAVPLKKITSVRSRGSCGFILQDWSTRRNFERSRNTISECMKEVSKLLKIRALHSSPYHPICSGLVEKFSATIKLILKRLCYEQKQQWPKYLGPLMFAYRKAPQESIRFSPFELLYGKTVRGPLQI